MEATGDPRRGGGRSSRTGDLCTGSPRGELLRGFGNRAGAHADERVDVFGDAATAPLVQQFQPC